MIIQTFLIFNQLTLHLLHMTENYLNIKVTFDERNRFRKYVNSVRDAYGDEAFGRDKEVESLVDKILCAGLFKEEL